MLSFFGFLVQLLMAVAAAAIIAAPIVLGYWYWKMKKINESAPTEELIKEIENEKGKYEKVADIRTKEREESIQNTRQSGTTETAIRERIVEEGISKSSGNELPDSSEVGSDKRDTTDSEPAIELHKPAAL